jgi:dTDP-4-amino-4,6-dideoxygalactose transaminase
MSTQLQIAFGDLRREYTELQQELDSVTERVLRSGWFILGQELSQFEEAFAAFLGAQYCVGCASGTDAIALALMAAGVGSGDEVITVAHTAVPTISAISMVGARPVFLDIEPDSCLMDVSQVEGAISSRTRAILPVHLYGQCVDMGLLKAISERTGIPVIEDCAQAHGATWSGQRAGTIGVMGAFSFYPSKNLGCYGDGGAIVTSDSKLAERLRMLRNYGQQRRYYHEIIGINSRLDELQAAILSAKLLYLTTWNQRRRQLASIYAVGLADLPVQTPAQLPGREHIYHLYVIQVSERDRLQSFLAENGIQTLIHYPVPAHFQPAYMHLGYASGSLPVTESVAEVILSLPMYPQLSDDEVNRVVAAIREFYH